MDIKNLVSVAIEKIECLQILMLQVVTFKKRIPEINEQYTKTYEEVSRIILFLAEEGVEVSNPNNFPSLWDWQKFSKQINGIPLKAKYIYDSYSDLISTLEGQLLQGQLHSSTSSPLSQQKVNEFFSFEYFQDLKSKIIRAKNLLSTIATLPQEERENKFDAFEETYKPLRSELDSKLNEISALLEVNLIHENSFISLWQWYGFWKENGFDTYQSRREYVENLYREVLDALDTSFSKKELFNLSSADFIQDFKARLVDSKSSLPEDESQETLQGVVCENNNDSDHDFEIADCVVMTAIQPERKKVCQVFGIIDDDKIRKDSRIYWKKNVAFSKGHSYKLVVAQCTDMGNAAASNLATDIIHHWRPKIMLLVGVAGAGSCDQSLGDIAVGRAVYCYEFGKEKADGRLIERDSLPADATLWNISQSLPDWTEPIEIPRPDGKDNRPQIHGGVIASGDKRISDADLRDHIADSYGNVVAIEMEGYGFSTAVWQNFAKIRHLVIRGICDLADAGENNDWHEYAATVAAQYTKHFLSDQPL